MECERCHNRTSSIIVKAVVNGRIRKLNLCDSCAAKLGYSTDMKKKSTFNDYAKVIIEELFESKKRMVCPVCHTDYITFKKNNELGCPSCYITFSNILKKLIEITSSQIIVRERYPYTVEELLPEKNINDEINILKRRLKVYTDFEDTDMIRKTLLKIRGLKKNDNNL
jgi:protein arginine kinase activator